MAQLTAVETKIVLELFESGGYVLDFTNSTFEAFFRDEVRANIYDEAYAYLGQSKGKRFRAFLERAQPAAVAKALTALWDYRLTLIRLKGEPDVAAGLAPDLSAVIVRLGGNPLALGPAKPKPDTEVQPAVQELAALESAYQDIMRLEPHPRGYAFEKFLKRLFDAWGLEARDAFKLVGEQIDGSFQLGDATVLLEAKWQNPPIELQTLQGFQGRVEDRPIWTRGLFVSYSSFSTEALQRFQTRRVILMNGFDLHLLLARKLSLRQILNRKSRWASETNQAYVSVDQLFPI